MPPRYANQCLGTKLLSHPDHLRPTRRPTRSWPLWIDTQVLSCERLKLGYPQTIGLPFAHSNDPMTWMITLGPLGSHQLIQYAETKPPQEVKTARVCVSRILFEGLGSCPWSSSMGSMECGHPTIIEDPFLGYGPVWVIYPTSDRDNGVSRHQPPVRHSCAVRSELALINGTTP